MLQKFTAFHLCVSSSLLLYRRLPSPEQLSGPCPSSRCLWQYPSCRSLPSCGRCPSLGTRHGHNSGPGLGGRIELHKSQTRPAQHSGLENGLEFILSLFWVLKTCKQSQDCGTKGFNKNRNKSHDGRSLSALL